MITINRKNTRLFFIAIISFVAVLAILRSMANAEVSMKEKTEANLLQDPANIRPEDTNIEGVGIANSIANENDNIEVAPETEINAGINIEESL